MTGRASASLMDNPSQEASRSGNRRVEILLVAAGAVLGAGLAFPAGKLLAALAVAAVIYGLVLIQPQRSLWLVISYAFIDYVLRKAGILSGPWDELAFIMIVGTWVLKMAWDMRARYKFTPLDWYLLGFLAVSLFLLLVRSPERHVAIEGLRAVVQYLFWFFVAVNMVKTGSQVRFFTVGFIILVGAIALFGIYQYVVGVAIPDKWIDQAEKGIKTRVFSIIGSPNILGSLLVLTIPMTVSIVFAVRSWWKRFAFTGLLGIMGLCLLFTYSRGAWLALIGAMFYYGVVHNRKVLALILIGAILAPVAVPSVTARMKYMMSEDYIKSSQKGGRLVRWEKAVKTVKKSPIVGVGLGRYGGAVATNNKLPGAFYVDNYYLKTLAEMGALGLGAMLWLFLNCMRFGTNAYRRAKDPFLRHLGAGIMAGLLGLLLHNAVENVFEVPMINTYFWFLLGMVGTFPWIAGKEADSCEAA